MPTQRTLVLLKPDTVRRGLVGNVLSRFEAKGLSIVALDLRTIDGASRIVAMSFCEPRSCRLQLSS